MRSLFGMAVGAAFVMSLSVLSAEAGAKTDWFYCDGELVTLSILEQRHNKNCDTSAVKGAASVRGDSPDRPDRPDDGGGTNPPGGGGGENPGKGKKGNNGHGNDPDHNDDSNPGKSNDPNDHSDADGKPGNSQGKGKKK